MKKKRIVSALFAGILVALAFSSPAAWAQAAPQKIEITARRFAYTPGDITLKKGQPVVLVLKSEDVAHGMRIRELHINLKVKAGGTAEVQFTPEKTGDFVGHCSVFCGAHHGSMIFRLHVVD
ncbi:MAG: cupredoxin domain-containing protein [Acidobacteriaceae bacterium]